MPVTTISSSADRPCWLTTPLFSLGLTLLSLLVGCGGDDGGGIAITPGGSPSSGEGGASTPGGSPSSGEGGASNLTVSVSLAWDPTPDSSVHAHFVHYGKASSGQSGSCDYPHSIHVTSNFATVTGLEPDTLYYFAVSAYNGEHSLCSNEVSTVTPSAT